MLGSPVDGLVAFHLVFVWWLLDDKSGRDDDGFVTGYFCNKPEDVFVVVNCCLSS